VLSARLAIDPAGRDQADQQAGAAPAKADKHRSGTVSRDIASSKSAGHYAAASW
jgi:hypothetical protein